MFRIAFDPSRPLVASSTFQAGGETIKGGDVFDWRARGIPQIDALAMFRSGLLVHPAPQPADAGPSLEECKRKLDEPVSRTVSLPVENPFVVTPSQQAKKRRDRR